MTAALIAIAILIIGPYLLAALYKARDNVVRHTEQEKANAAANNRRPNIDDERGPLPIFLLRQAD